MVVSFHRWFVIAFVLAGQFTGAALAIFGVPLAIALAIVGLLL
jgi:hypothetical protein